LEHTNVRYERDTLMAQAATSHPGFAPGANASMTCTRTRQCNRVGFSQASKQRTSLLSSANAIIGWIRLRRVQTEISAGECKIQGECRAPERGPPGKIDRQLSALDELSSLLPPEVDRGGADFGRWGSYRSVARPKNHCERGAATLNAFLSDHRVLRKQQQQPPSSAFLLLYSAFQTRQRQDGHSQHCDIRWRPLRS
jgi:hypothetical protein